MDLHATNVPLSAPINYVGPRPAVLETVLSTNFLFHVLPVSDL